MVIVQRIGESGIYNEEDIVAAIGGYHNELAGAVLPSICYYTSQLLDMCQINGAFLNKNVLCVWDLACVGEVQHALLEIALCVARAADIIVRMAILAVRALSIKMLPSQEIMSNDSVGISPTPMSIKHLSVETRCGRPNSSLWKACSAMKGATLVLSLKITLLQQTQIFSCYDISSIMALREALCKCLIQS